MIARKISARCRLEFVAFERRIDVARRRVAVAVEAAAAVGVLGPDAVLLERRTPLLVRAQDPTHHLRIRKEYDVKCTD